MKKRTKIILLSILGIVVILAVLSILGYYSAGIK
jgi:hypothetical protein